MLKWEYSMLRQNIVDRMPSGYSHASNLWNKEDQGRFMDDGGRSALDQVNDLGKSGWELASVTPIASCPASGFTGQTTELLFTFKRPAGE